MKKEMSIAVEENKLAVTIKRLMWEFKLSWKFIFADKNNDKNKTNLLPLLSIPVTVFLIAEKLLRLWLWNFQTFSFFLLPVWWKIKPSCMSGLFCIVNLLEVGESQISNQWIAILYPQNDGSNFTPNPLSASIGMNLVSFFIHWITSHFLNNSFCKLFYTYFYCLYLCVTKPFALKAELYFILFWFALG